MSSSSASLRSFLTALSPQKQAALLADVERRLAEGLLFDYRPYAKQRDFHAAGARFRERLFMAGNQLGKTWAGGFEGGMHATGIYPDWWDGRRFDHPTVAWVAGVTGELTRDGPQRILMGRAPYWGTGAIPKERIKAIHRRPHGVKDSLEAVEVYWGEGGADVQTGISRIGFKSYDQGREKFQSETLDWIWNDEEPPEDIYTEELTRTNAGDRGRMGMLFTTFTPLKGMSKVVARFLLEEAFGTVVIRMGIAEAEHYTAEQREAIIAGYPPHEREARANGTPLFGSGLVFTIADETIRVDPFVPPDIWPCIGGMDFGWDHPSAGVKLHHDRDTDTLYVSGAVRGRQMTPLLFAQNVKPWGLWLPWAWPHDGLQHDKGSGIQLAAQYAEQGLNMLPEKATFEDGTYNVEPGITGMLDYMQAGRFKVMSHLTEWFDEKSAYHRKDGVIVKERDDLMSATRVAFMMRRFARLKPRQRTHRERNRSWRTA